MRTGSPARLAAIDAHTAGGLLRLVVSGLPAASGRSRTEVRLYEGGVPGSGVAIADLAASLNRRTLQRIDAVAREPRGYDGVSVALLTAPELPHSDAGVLVRRSGRFVPCIGEAVVAVSTIAIERHLILPARPGILQFDTQAGPIAVTYDMAQGNPAAGAPRVTEVRYVGPEACVLAGGVDVMAGPRRSVADVVFAGEWLAIVDAESAGIPLTTSVAPLRDAGVAIAGALERRVRRIFTAAGETPPVPLSMSVVFTGPAGDGDACVRAAVVRADGAVERWASGTALASVLAVLSEMELIATGAPLQLEGLTGLRIRGRVVGRRQQGTRQLVSVEVAGTSWMTAEHEFVLHPDDPLRRGLVE